ncbi:hypothetical protein U1Q18_025867 [Sarracenia purpurea var. burkii]
MEDMTSEKTTAPFSLEEREAAYLAARERIFTRYDGETSKPVKQKPRSIPVVARRMIAHALGGRIIPSNQAVGFRDTKEYGEQADEMNIQEKEEGNAHMNMGTYEEIEVPFGQNVKPYRKPKVSNSNDVASLHTEKLALRPADKTSTQARNSQRNDMVARKDNLKEEHMGAAKRMFAHALGRHSAKDGILSKGSEMKQTE